MSHVETVCVGRGKDAEWAGKLKRTAIDKRAVDGPAVVRRLGLDGDEQVDTANHGGADQAVYAYAREDLDWWAGQLDTPLRDGHFGENLTTVGLDLVNALVGERWRVGSVLLEVAGPRIPCVVFQNWLEQPTWVRRFTEASRCGAYLRVLEEGTLSAGDTVTVTRPDHDVTVRDTFRALTTEPELAERVAAVAAPSSKLRWMATRVAARISKDYTPV